METLDDQQLLFFVQLHLVLHALVGKGRVEPLLERLDRVEDLGQCKVEQGPQFGQVVLHVHVSPHCHTACWHRTWRGVPVKIKR